MQLRGMSVSLNSRKGLTLLELVIVLVILAAVAALVISRLDFLKSQADYSQGAAGSADVMNNLQVFKTTTGSYPERMDSLLEISGSPPVPTVPLTKLWFHPPFTMGGTWLEMVDINALAVAPGIGGTGWRTSFGHSGISSVMDNDPAVADPSSSGTTLRALGSTAPLTRTVALVKLSTVDATTKPLETAAGFPNGLPVDGSGNPTVRLVAFGVGPNCGAVGTTMANCPMHSAAKSTDYGRFIAVFAVYGSGKGMELRTVIDSRHQPIDSNIGSFRNAAPTEN